jgi:anti-anti-sigma factor
MQDYRGLRCPTFQNYGSKIVFVQIRHATAIIYVLFMIPKPLLARLCNSMQFIQTTCQTWPPQQRFDGLGIQPKGWKLKLSLKTRHRDDVIIVHCQGRIVYRDEAAALSQLVGEILEHQGKIVLDLSGVSLIDSAGIGELVLLHTWAQAKDADLRVASPSPFVRRVLDLTHLDSFLDIHSTLGEALTSELLPQAEPLCADC